MGRFGGEGSTMWEKQKSSIQHNVCNKVQAGCASWREARLRELRATEPMADYRYFCLAELRGNVESHSIRSRFIRSNSHIILRP
jgi:hypothetical protein